MGEPKLIVRRPKAAEDIERHAMFIAQDNIESALRFLDAAEQTINNLAIFSTSGAPFNSRMPELQGIRTKLVKKFPNYVVFYIEREDVIEVVRVLGAGQNTEVEIWGN